MLIRILYTLFWLYLLNPFIVLVVLAALQSVFFPLWTVTLQFTNTVALTILWYHIWMWVRVKNIELDDSVRKALGL